MVATSLNYIVEQFSFDYLGLAFMYETLWSNQKVLIDRVSKDMGEWKENNFHVK